MFPVLFKVGPLVIHTYGFLIALGFLLSTRVLRKLSIHEGLDPEKILDISFMGLFLGMLGGRILFVITRWESFAHDPIAIFKVWEGGLVFFGGLVCVVLFLIYYLNKNKIPFWKVADISAPVLVLTHAFGRLGCFSSGCCYGKPTQSIFGIRFNTDLIEPHLRGIPLHPTQIYESFSLFILFFILMYLAPRKKFDGQLAFTYFLIYPVVRSIIEIFRGDVIRGFIIDDWLSTSQFISILIFSTASVVLIIRLRQIKIKK